MFSASLGGLTGQLFGVLFLLLLRVDHYWMTKLVVLGCEIDTVAMTTLSW